MTTTRTLLGSLALCISLASASSRASTTSERASHQPSSGSGANWTAALPVRPAALSEHHAAHHGEALRQDAPEEGAKYHAVKKTESGKGVKGYAFKHDKVYEGHNEEDRKLTTKGGELVDLEVNMDAGFRTEAHAHVGQAIVAAREQQKSAELERYYANVEQLKVDRDLEQKKLIEKKYTNAIESEEKRYAPNVDAMKKRGATPFRRIADLGEYTDEGVWKPKALTKEELTAILGVLAEKSVVDQDDQTYDYLHPVTLQKAQMVAFSTDPKMVRANQKYAERADEFFWRRAPAVFTPAGQRVVTKAGQADHRRAVMRNARANAQGSVKIIDLGEGLKPWTQKHFEQYVKHTGLAEEWHSYGEAGACRRVTAAAVAQAKHREEAYEQQLMREVLNKQIVVQEELIAERPRHPRAKLNKLRAELEKFEADILAMWVGRIPGAGAY